LTSTPRSGDAWGKQQTRPGFKLRSTVSRVRSASAPAASPQGLKANCYISTTLRVNEQIPEADRPRKHRRLSSRLSPLSIMPGKGDHRPLPPGKHQSNSAPSGIRTNSQRRKRRRDPQERQSITVGDSIRRNADARVMRRAAWLPPLATHRTGCEQPGVEPRTHARNPSCFACSNDPAAPARCAGRLRLRAGELRTHGASDPDATQNGPTCAHEKRTTLFFVWLSPSEQITPYGS